MPEAGNSNIEVTHHLGEHKASSHTLGHQILEIGEAIVLAIVAIATAWSGYQAALWTGEQAQLYGKSSKLRIQAEGVATTADQERLYNAATVAEWLKAEANGQKKLSRLFENFRGLVIQFCRLFCPGTLVFLHRLRTRRSFRIVERVRLLPGLERGTIFGKEPPFE
jgi:hypothetical protein